MASKICFDLGGLPSLVDVDTRGAARLGVADSGDHGLLARDHPDLALVAESDLLDAIVFGAQADAIVAVGRRFALLYNGVMKRTRVARSTTLTISCLVVAAASWGFLAWIFAIDASGGNKIMGSVLLGGLGLVALIGAAFGSKKAACPECGAKIYPDPDREMLCDTCNAAVLQRGDEVERVEAGHVASTRCFGLPLRAGATFPQLCACCGALSTRTVPVEYRLSFAWKAFIAAASAAAGHLAYADEKVSAKVPVCDAHDDGGEIKDLHKEDVVLCVRSWGFAKAYREMNEGVEVTMVHPHLASAPSSVRAEKPTAASKPE